MIRDALLVFGLLLSTATQLRISGLPLGPGETCLALWFGLGLALRIRDLSLIPNTALMRLISFWLVIAAAECVGMMMGFAVELFFDTESIIHDLTAYTLLVGVGCMAALDLADDYRRRRVVWLFASFGAALFIVLLANGMGLFSFSMVEPWYFNRLKGWSKDPNQLGFVASALTILAIFLAETARKALEVICSLCCAILAFSIGLLTRSDTYVACILSASVVFIIVKSWRALQNRESCLTVGAAFIWLMIASLPLTVLAAAPFVPAAIKAVDEYSEAVYDEDGQGETRLELWSEAISKGVESSLLGFGPGAHLTNKSYKEPPPHKFEAHNAPLQLLTQGGVLASLAFLWLCLSAVYNSWRAHLPAITAMACTLFVFSLTHYVVRHPVFWFCIVICLLEVERAKRTDHKERRSRVVMLRSPINSTGVLS